MGERGFEIMSDSPMFDDMTHRYAPDRVVVANWDGGGKGPDGWTCPVLQYIAHGPEDPARSCIRRGMVALQLVTAKGDRWYGCQRAYINAELRMVVVGTNSRDEVRMKWEAVPEGLTDGQ